MVMCLLWHNRFAMKHTTSYYSPKQGRAQVFISDCIKISDSVITFDHIIEGIEVKIYLKNITPKVGRKGYNPSICKKQSCLVLWTKGIYP